MTWKKHSNTILRVHWNQSRGMEVIIMIEKWKLSSLFPALDGILIGDLLIFFISLTTCAAQVQRVRWLDFDCIWQDQSGILTERYLKISQNIDPLVWLFYRKRTTWCGTVVSKNIVMITTYFVLALNRKPFIHTWLCISQHNAILFPYLKYQEDKNDRKTYLNYFVSLATRSGPPFMATKGI